MRYACIGSGSSGNAAVFEHDGRAFLLDCGLTIKETERRLGVLGLDPACLEAIVVTHEHGDHLSGVAPFARRHHLPVWMTRGTWRRARDRRIHDLRLYRAGETLEIGPFSLSPFAVPHDAAEACQFRIQCASQSMAVLTDLGMITPHIVECVDGVSSLVLECNHDEQMLSDGPYPPSLQARVAGNYGHLSNRQAAGLLERIDADRLERVFLAHLSERNNTATLARACVAAVMSDGDARLTVLSAEECGEWMEPGAYPSAAASLSS